MKQNLILGVATTLLSFLVLEGILRSLEPPAHENSSPQGFFSVRSAELGWDGKPDAEGYYASGFCYGHVINNRYGNRMNSARGTFEADYANVLFIGDSNTVSLEVDDDETVPARLEVELRRRGMRLNVINLGVRGYGTDQSVRKALMHAQRTQPEQIVYMFTDKDNFDNNVVRLPTGHHGKGVYLRRGSDGFLAHNYPVPAYEPGFWGAVLVDDQERSFLYTGTQSQNQTMAALPWYLELSAGLEKSLLVYRGILDLKRAVFPASAYERKWHFWKHRRADPWTVMTSDDRDNVDVLFALLFSSFDGGFGRIRHREYYEGQFRHLIGMLRDIPSLRRVHLVEYPSVATLELLKSKRPSTNRQLFESLLSEKLIDSYVNLNEALRNDSIDLRDLECRRGDHFTAAGNRWVAEAILEEVSFGD